MGVRIGNVLDVASWERLLLGVVHRHTKLKLVEVGGSGNLVRSV